MSDSPHYLGHRQRLKERLMRNPRELADYEVLELVLASVLPRRDTKPLAKELLSRFGTLRSVLGASSEQLEEMKGVGPAVLSHWRLLREVHARLAEGRMAETEVLSSVQAVADAAMARLGTKRREEFWAVLLDASNRVIAWECVNSGTVDRVDAYPREILALALKKQARGLILVHNHPGGNPAPSEDDRTLTLGMVKVASALQILVRDHVIVCDGKYFSFHENGLL